MACLKARTAKTGAGVSGGSIAPVVSGSGQSQSDSSLAVVAAQSSIPASCFEAPASQCSIVVATNDI